MHRTYSMRFVLLCSFSMTGAFVAGLLDVLKGQLPYNMWVPWECTSLFTFLSTSIQEIAGVTIATVVNVATETTVLGFSLQVCAQFEILKHRLQRMMENSNEKMSPKNSLNNGSHKINKLATHIFHHVCIIRFVK